MLYLNLHIIPFEFFQANKGKLRCTILSTEEGKERVLFYSCQIILCHEGNVGVATGSTEINYTTKFYSSFSFKPLNINLPTTKAFYGIYQINDIFLNVGEKLYISQFPFSYTTQLIEIFSHNYHHYITNPKRLEEYLKEFSDLLEQNNKLIMYNKEQFITNIRQNSDDCTICLEPLYDKEFDELIELQCKHTYCRDCIQVLEYWYCPQCFSRQKQEETNNNSQYAEVINLQKNNREIEQKVTKIDEILSYLKYSYHEIEMQLSDYNKTIILTIEEVQEFNKKYYGNSYGGCNCASCTSLYGSYAYNGYVGAVGAIGPTGYTGYMGAGKTAAAVSTYLSWSRQPTLYSQGVYPLQGKPINTRIKVKKKSNLQVYNLLNSFYIADNIKKKPLSIKVDKSKYLPDIERELYGTTTKDKVKEKIHIKYNIPKIQKQNKKLIRY